MKHQRRQRLTTTEGGLMDHWCSAKVQGEGAENREGRLGRRQRRVLAEKRFN
jgi:hypothetical protein